MIIETPSRLHITLIDLNGAIGRIDGGVGLTIREPNLVLKAEEIEEGIEVLFEEDGLSSELIDEYREKIQNSAQKIIENLKINAGFKFTIKKTYPAHSGLGSGTQISLAVGKTISKIQNKDMNAFSIAKIVGRGGTSGIGVRSFDHGGFILDGGHKVEEKPDFLPSSASKASPAPLITRYDFPQDWKIILAIPNVPAGASGPKEVNIFQKYCPIPLIEVQKLSHILLMKMMPSVVEKDLDSFGSSINEVQDTGFKKIELQLQNPVINDIIENMRSEGAAGVGMSSFGPTVYAVTDSNLKGISKSVYETMKDIGGNVINTNAWNKGYTIK